MNRQDKRSRKTEQTVQNTLIRLLCEISIQKIKIIDLCTTADINRTTFYLHYNSVQDVLDQLRHEIAEKTFANKQSRSDFEKQKSPLPFFYALADIIQSYPYLSKFIRSASSDSAVFLILLKNDITEKLFKLYEQTFRIHNFGIKYTIEFITVGFIDLYVEWLKRNDQSESFDQVFEQCKPLLREAQRQITQTAE